jgi:hypothetical protein
MPIIAWLVAFMGSALAGIVAVRTSEVQPAVLVIAVVCMILGFATPKYAWLWALIVGLGVFVGYLVARWIGYHPASPAMIANRENIFGSLIALAPAFIAAYVGAGARWIAAPGMRSPIAK